MIPGMFPKMKRPPRSSAEDGLLDVEPAVRASDMVNFMLMSGVEVGEYLDEFSSPKKSSARKPSRPQTEKVDKRRPERKASASSIVLPNNPVVANLEAECSIKTQQIQHLREELDNLKEEHEAAIEAKDNQIQGLLVALDRVGSTASEELDLEPTPEESDLLTNTLSKQHEYYKEQMVRELSLKDQQLRSTQLHLEETEKELERITKGLSSGGTARQRMIEISLREELEEERKKADARVLEVESTVGEALRVAERNIKYNEKVFQKKHEETIAAMQAEHKAKVKEMHANAVEAKQKADAEIAEQAKRIENLRHRVEVEKQLAVDNLDRIQRLHDEQISKLKFDHGTMFEEALQRKDDEHSKQLRVLQLKQTLALKELNTQLNKAMAAYEPLVEKNREQYEQLALLGVVDPEEEEHGPWGMNRARRPSVMEDAKVSIMELEKKLDDAIVKASTKYPNSYSQHASLVVRTMSNENEINREGTLDTGVRSTIS